MRKLKLKQMQALKGCAYCIFTHGFFTYLPKNAYAFVRNLSSSTVEGRIPVLIVGAGPVGLVLSFLLNKLGVQCSVIEKNCRIRDHPQAHFINNRSMEIFRKLDGLSENIEELQPPLDQWRKFVYCSSLFGSILGTVDHMQPKDLDKTRSPTTVAHFSQHRLVPLLLKKLQQRGFKLAATDNIDYDTCSRESWSETIRLGHECVSIKATSDGIRTAVRYNRFGLSTFRTILCDILVGADGAASTVRELMGIQMHGERALQRLISVHFFSKELGCYLSKERPGMLYFVFNPDAIGVIIAHDFYKGEFVMQTPFYPPQQSFEDYTSEACSRLIFNLVGRKLVDIEIKSIKQWRMDAEVAEKYSACDGRVLLVGDAAHRFPPAGGFGMNTGIQDAHNLAWKLASVLSGHASPGILCTYELERKPIAITNTLLSLKNFKAAMSVPTALGLNPDVANSVHKTINSGIASVLPSTLKTFLLESIFAVGRAQLSDPIMNRHNPFGYHRLERVKDILERGQSLQLQFPAEDIGFRYRQGALVPEKTALNDDTQQEEPSGRRREYIPCTKPGSRLPHMQIRVRRQNMLHLNNEYCSTLDLISGNAVEFLLIIAPAKACYDWADAACRVANAYDIPLLVSILWPEGTFVNQTSQKSKHDERSVTEDNKFPALRDSFVNEWVKNTKHVIDIEETSVSFWELCKMPTPCAILVRPDEHIAWRSDPQFSGDFIDEMSSVFSMVLRRPKLSIQ